MLWGLIESWVYPSKADEEVLDQPEVIDSVLAQLAIATMEHKNDFAILVYILETNLLTCSRASL